MQLKIPQKHEKINKEMKKNITHSICIRVWQTEHWRKTLFLEPWMNTVWCKTVAPSCSTRAPAVRQSVIHSSWGAERHLAVCLVPSVSLCWWCAPQRPFTPREVRKCLSTHTHTPTMCNVLFEFKSIHFVFKHKSFFSFATSTCISFYRSNDYEKQ